MQVYVTKLTTFDLLLKACKVTSGLDMKRPDFQRIYQSGHSPIYTQIFWIDMVDIFTFVSNHLARHKIGVEHYVKSNREDRGGDDKADRWTPVNHSMLINAQALINLSRRRLCNKAHIETINIMQAIKEAVKEKDPDLAGCMVPECIYRGACYELTPCNKGSISKF